jgi:hypothetical protein
MKILFALLLLIGSAQAQILAQILQQQRAQSQWDSVPVQHVINGSCSLSSHTCVVTLTQTIGTGNLIVAWAGYTHTTQTPTISALTGQTVTTCTACTATDGNNKGVISYSLSSVAQATSITVTLNGTSNFSSAWTAEVAEFHCTSCSSITLDAGATPASNRDQSASTTTPAGVTLAISGTSDAIIQANFSLGTVTASPNCMSAGSLSAGWVCDAPGGDGFGWLLNTSVVATPAWAQTNAKAALSAIAFTANP